MFTDLAQSDTQKIPKLRFPGFSGVPSSAKATAGNWEEKRLGGFGKFLGGGTPSKNISKYWNGDIAWVSSSDISEKEFAPNITRFITREAIEKSATKIIPKNSLLIVSRVGVGKFAISNIDLCTSQDFTNFLPNKNIDIVFSAFLLKSNTKKLLSFSQGTSIKGFTKSDLENLKINIPTLPEQQKIASFLSSVDKWVENLWMQKESLEKYKKGMMQKLFSQEIRFKDKNGNDFGDWEEKRLGEVAVINPDNKELPKEFVYIDLESVEKGTLKQERVIKKNNAPSRAQRKLEKKDILFQTVRPYQQNNLFFNKNGEYVASTGYAQIRTKENPMFLYQYLHIGTFLNKVLARCTGTSYPTINNNDLKTIKIDIPSLPEQQKIADFLTLLDDMVESKQKQIEKAEKWKKGIMQGVFV